MVISKHTRIASNTTTVLYNQSIVLAQIAFLVSNAGTTWSIKFQDQDGSPAIVFGPWTAVLPTDGKPVVITFTNLSGGTGCPLPMKTGFNCITSGAAAGVIDVWTSIFQPSTNQ